MEKVIIFGAGGHAKVIFDIISKEKKYDVAAFASLSSDKKELFGIPILSQDDFLKLNIQSGIVAVGDNLTRDRLTKTILEKSPHFKFVTAIHPSSQVGHDVQIGPGSVLMANTAVNPGTVIGEHVIINTGASIDHDCRIENFASIAPGATLGGNVKVGSHSAVSLGANVIHGISIGQNSVIGAGSTVLTDIGNFDLAYGTPCKVIRKRHADEKYL